MTALLQLIGVTHRWGAGPTAVAALQDVDLEIGRGELVAVMGTSGSGKSTLLAIAAGLTTPSAGTVLVDGRPLAGMTAKELAALRRSSIGLVFQDYNLVPTLTAAENVGLPLELAGRSPRSIRQEVLAALTAVGLGEVTRAFPEELSGGQQQRVAIARAVIGPRTLILADEPTGALDSRTGEQVLRALRARIDVGAGGILVTHDSRHAAWADRVVFLRDGRQVDTQRADRAESLLRAGS